MTEKEFFQFAFLKIKNKKYPEVQTEKIMYEKILEIGNQTINKVKFF